MGAGSFTSQDWKNYASSNVYGKTTSQIYKAIKMKDEFNPYGVKRESCDSDEHPESTPIIIGLDVTGSMNNILNEVAQQLGDMVTEILEREPVKDPQILFAAIGDHACDEYPLQVTQFESDIRIAKQLTELYFEEGGGGNGFESYPLAWYFAGSHTKCDRFFKGRGKGFLFTMGDDGFPKSIPTECIKKIFGDEFELNNLTTEQILSVASRNWQIFHLILKQGSNLNSSWTPDSEKNRIIGDWTNLLGERAIMVSDYTKVPQIIVSLLEAMAGRKVDDIVASWDGSTAVVVKEALSGLKEKKENRGLVEFT